MKLDPIDILSEFAKYRDRQYCRAATDNKWRLDNSDDAGDIASYVLQCGAQDIFNAYYSVKGFVQALRSCAMLLPSDLDKMDAVNDERMRGALESWYTLGRKKVDQLITEREALYNEKDN